MGYVARFRFARIAFRAAKWKPERKDRRAGKERRETDEMNSGVRVLTLNRPIEPGHKRRQRRQFRSAGVIRLNATGAFIRAANEHYKAAPMLNATDPGGWIARSVVNSRFTALTSAGDENVSPSNDGGRILSAGTWGRTHRPANIGPWIVHCFSTDSSPRHSIPTRVADHKQRYVQKVCNIKWRKIKCV